MPFSQKQIVCINGSRSITDVNLDNYINYQEIGTVISGAANGVDTLAERWAKKHKLEFLAFPAQWDKFGQQAGLMRNKDMIHFCDKLISIWDGKSTGTLHAIHYAIQINKPYEIHLIVETD